MPRRGLSQDDSRALAGWGVRSRLRDQLTALFVARVAARAVELYEHIGVRLRPLRRGRRDADD